MLAEIIATSQAIHSFTFQLPLARILATALDYPARLYSNVGAFKGTEGETMTLERTRVTD